MHDLSDLRALHFDCDVLARSKACAVHLPQGCRRHWYGLELGKGGLEGLPQVTLDYHSDGRKRDTWNFILEQGKLFDIFTGEEINSRAQELPDFDQDSSQFQRALSDFDRAPSVSSRVLKEVVGMAPKPGTDELTEKTEHQAEEQAKNLEAASTTAQSKSLHTFTAEHLMFRAIARVAQVTPRRSLLHSKSAEDTHQFGKRLAAQLKKGDTVLLRGSIGTGKSVLARGIATGMGATQWRGSPTFNLIHEYETSPALYHIDLYRLDALQTEMLGLEEYARPDTVVLIEWADRAPQYLAALSTERTLEIDLEYSGGDGRRIVATWRIGSYLSESK